MSLTSGAVVVAGTGEIYVAPENTAMPTDFTALPATWKGLGYTSTDGVSFSKNRETQNLDAWQGSKVRVLTLSEPVTLTARLLEMKTDVLLATFGGGTVSQAGGVSTFTPPAEGTNTVRAMVIDVTDNDRKYRFCFRRTQIEGAVDFSLTRTDAVGFNVTWGVLTSESGTWFALSDDTTNWTVGS